MTATPIQSGKAYLVTYQQYHFTILAAHPCDAICIAFDMNLRILTDRELIRYADNACNDLTTTPFESELLRRFAEALPLLEAFDVNDVQGIQETLSDVVEIESYAPFSEIRKLVMELDIMRGALYQDSLIETFYYMKENQK